MLLTIDTGGTKTLVAGFSRAGKPGREHRFPTPLDRGEYIRQLLQIISDHYADKELQAVTIAVPGRIRHNIVEWCGNLPWENFDITQELRTHLSCPIWVENDANLAGLAEVHALHTRPQQGLYLTISTGIGSGIIIDGAIHPGLSASEAGHMVVEYGGSMRQWESFASGRAIKAAYGKYARDIHEQKTWHEVADKVSRGLLVLIPALQPDVIIIGGSIGTYFERYGESLQRQLAAHLPPHITMPEIRQALHPEEAVIYGCYHYGTAQLELATHHG